MCFYAYIQGKLTIIQWISLWMLIINVTLIYIDSEYLGVVLIPIIITTLVFWLMIITSIFEFTFMFHRSFYKGNKDLYQEPNSFSPELVIYQVPILVFSLFPILIFSQHESETLEVQGSFSFYSDMLICTCVPAWYFLAVKPSLRFLLDWKNK